jgi:hypothetical protein
MMSVFAYLGPVWLALIVIGLVSSSTETFIYDEDDL